VRYFDAVTAKDLSIVQGSEILDDEQIALEKVMLALRTSEGISESYLMANCQASAVEAALAEGNLVRTSDARIRIPENRFFISDAVISSLF
jgi:coproporphyrinogen III oxidase-like Fe-S oxidoreductase